MKAAPTSSNTMGRAGPKRRRTRLSVVYLSDDYAGLIMTVGAFHSTKNGIIRPSSTLLLLAWRTHRSRRDASYNEAAAVPNSPCLWIYAMTSSATTYLHGRASRIISSYHGNVCRALQCRIIINDQATAMYVCTHDDTQPHATGARKTRRYINHVGS